MSAEVILSKQYPGTIVMQMHNVNLPTYCTLVRQVFSGTNLFRYGDYGLGRSLGTSNPSTPPPLDPLCNVSPRSFACIALLQENNKRSLPDSDLGTV